MDFLNSVCVCVCVVYKRLGLSWSPDRVESAPVDEVEGAPRVNAH